MVRGKKLIALFISLCIFFGLAGCELLEKTPEGEKKTVVASVNKQKLTKGEFEKRFQGQIIMYESIYGKGFFEKKQNQETIKNLKADFLNNIVSEMLLLQKAEELKVVPDSATLESEINKSIEEDKKGKTEEQFQKELSEFKITFEDYKENIRKSIILDKLYALITKDVTVADTEIFNYYNMNLYDFTEKPNTMNVSRILLDNEEEALKVLDEYKAGAKFEDLAKKYSKETETKDKGGSLGEVAYNDANQDKTFLAAAITIKPGKISPPVQTNLGYYIIKVNSKKEYPVKPVEKVKEDIRLQLLAEAKDKKFRETAETWMQKAKVKMYPDKL